MLTLTITDEQLQTAFDSHLNKLLETDNYNNPIKKCVDDLLGYNGDKGIKAQIEVAVRQHLQVAMASPQFALALGTAMAAEMAKREVDKLKR